MPIIAIVDPYDIYFFGALLLFFIFILFLLFCLGIWAQRNRKGVSPYTKHPLRRATDLPYESAKKILQFLYDKQEYDNRIFELQKAVYCRETGRLFTNCISWLDTVHVDWDFLQKRYPGNYVSWGSLSDLEKTLIRDAHGGSLAGFQTQYSSIRSDPKAVEEEYIYRKPGPLYVDLTTWVLLGWQIVPDTQFEVLIVKKPKQ